MPLSPVTKLYSVQDCKISPLLTDPAAGAATYGDPIDVPGIQTMAISGSMETKVLRGDNMKLASNSALTDVSVQVTHAKLSVAVLAAILGGASTAAGTTPTQTLTWDLSSDDATLPPFKLEGITPPNGVDIIGGDLHWILHKCSLSAFPDLGFAQEDFRVVSFTAAADPLISTGKWITAVLHETYTAIDDGS
ncbi:phage tail protein [Actinacidiphila sp. ITFR-21]|uniref:phage tail protein n=1 Tax=Actinacidiphila sp. ITFR-21 TaxID=3075199 RepID=UPI00288A5604|nr:phage tail protein [Streptomyces sp. ITFR-21]WNI15576.1 phage tail protein [Streptomyces sp. ITFR-21]